MQTENILKKRYEKIKNKRQDLFSHTYIQNNHVNYVFSYGVINRSTIINDLWEIVNTYENNDKPQTNTYRYTHTNQVN